MLQLKRQQKLSQAKEREIQKQKLLDEKREQKLQKARERERLRREKLRDLQKTKKWREKDKLQLLERIKQRYLQFMKLRISVTEVDPLSKQLREQERNTKRQQQQQQAVEKKRVRKELTKYSSGPTDRASRRRTGPWEQSQTEAQPERLLETELLLVE